MSGRAEEAARFLAWMRRAKEWCQAREASGEHEKLLADIEEVGREMAAQLRTEGRFAPSEQRSYDDKALLATLTRLRDRRLSDEGEDER